MDFIEKPLNFSNKLIVRISEDEFVVFWTEVKMLAAKSISLYVKLRLWLHAKQLMNKCNILGHDLPSWKLFEKINHCIQEFVELK